MGVRLSQFVRNPACRGEDIAVIEPEKSIRLDDLIVHSHGDSPAGLAVGEHEIPFDQVVQGRQLVIRVVVLAIPTSDLRIRAPRHDVRPM